MSTNFYRELHKQLNVIPWRRPEKTIFGLLVIFAVVNLVLNLAVFLGH